MYFLPFHEVLMVALIFFFDFPKSKCGRKCNSTNEKKPKNVRLDFQESTIVKCIVRLIETQNAESL